MNRDYLPGQYVIDAEPSSADLRRAVAKLFEQGKIIGKLSIDDVLLNADPYCEDKRREARELWYREQRQRLQEEQRQQQEYAACETALRQRQRQDAAEDAAIAQRDKDERRRAEMRRRNGK